MRPYTPPEGHLVSDVEKTWSKLEKAEHDRGIALRKELIRQERLERLAEKFTRKVQKLIISLQTHSSKLCNSQALVLKYRILFSSHIKVMFVGTNGFQ